MNKKILLCEDDQSILEIMSLVLKNKGYDVMVESENTDSIIGSNADLILLDLGLAKESGKEIAQKLKKNDQTKNIPLIIVSASLDIEHTAQEAGAEDFLKKPFDIEALEKIVHKYIPNEKRN